MIIRRSHKIRKGRTLNSGYEARKIGNEIYVFLRDKLKLPINREKSGIRRPVNFSILGYGFVPTYQKGVKGQYQLIVEKSRWNRPEGAHEHHIEIKNV